MLCVPLESLFDLLIHLNLLFLYQVESLIIEFLEYVDIRCQLRSQLNVQLIVLK